MKNLMKNMLVLAGFALCAQVTAHAQVIAYYDSGNTVDASPSSNPFSVQYVTPTYGTAGTGTSTVSNLTLGSGISGTNLYHYGFGFSFSTGASTTLAAAETNNAYIGFTVTPNAGMKLDLTDLDFSGGSFYSQDGGGSTRTLYLESSVNGFTTQTSVGSLAVPANVFSSGSDLSLGTDFSTLKTATEFRLYIVDPDHNPYESVTVKGSDFLSINGTAALIPEPSTYALVACGLGFAVLLLRKRRA